MPESIGLERVCRRETADSPYYSETMKNRIQITLMSEIAIGLIPGNGRIRSPVDEKAGSL